MKKHNSISYEIHEGYAYGVKESSVSVLDTVINFSPEINGYMLIGAYTFNIVNGVCRPDMHLFDDGELCVSVHDGTSVIGADKIKRCGKLITLVSGGENEQRALRRELISLKNQINKIKNELEYLYSKIDGVSIL